MRGQKRIRSSIVVFLLATLGAAVLVAPSSSTPVRAAGAIVPRAECASLTGLDLTRRLTVVETAEVQSREGQEYCTLTGYIAPQTHFEILLPTRTWTGDYLQQGCGGFCGSSDVSLTDPSRTSLHQAPYAPLSAGELVVATSDTGHQTIRNSDTLWARNDPRLRVEYGYASEHRLARTAKAVIRHFYGRRADNRYFVGVSNGGRQALNLAARYPRDFDGIIAGAPANNWSALAGLFWPWLVRQNLDQDDRAVLTAEKLPALHAAVMNACANRRGVIRDPRTCTFRPATIECPSGTDRATCLTPAEVRVVRAFYRGPTGPGGRHLFDGGMAYGSELAWLGWAVQPAADEAAPGNTIAAALGLNYLRHAAFWRNPSATLDARDVAFTARAHRRLQRVGDLYDATDPDLRRFRAHGGKLLMYHGWSDQGIPPFQTLNYYRALTRWSGGFAASQEFSRLYMVPGLYHCPDPCGPEAAGDPETVLDVMTPLVSWVREGVAPATLRLPVTDKTTGAPLTTLSVAPFDPTRRAPRNAGLNSNYDYVGRATTYTPRAALWCRQKGPDLECRRR